MGVVGDKTQESDVKTVKNSLNEKDYSDLSIKYLIITLHIYKMWLTKVNERKTDVILIVGYYL